MMTSHPRVNRAMTSLLISIVFVTCACTDDFDELKMENELGTYTNGYFKNRDNVIEGFNGLNGSIVFENDLLWFTCNGVIPFIGVFPQFKDVVYPKQVAIRYCVLPTSPLADALQELNINVSRIEFLQLATIHITEPIPRAEYMQGLNLKTLFLDALYSSNMFEKNPDFLKPLTNLTALMVWGLQVPKLPENIHLEVLSFRHDAHILEWTNCKHLRTLSIHDVMTMFIPYNWPEECQNLTRIRLSGMTSLASHLVMASGVDKAAVKLETLHMRYCNLSYPPYEILKTAKNLKHLNLTGNRIYDETLIQIPLMENLTNLDLSRNSLTGITLNDLTKHTPNLLHFNLDGNRRFINSFCNKTYIKTFSLQLTSLERLSFEDVPISPDCFRNTHFANLKYLNLASSIKISGLSNETLKFDLRQLPTTDANHLEVDLRGRHVSLIQFTSEDYFALRNGDYYQLWGSKKINNRPLRPHLTVFLNNTQYDCRNHWFCVALNEFPDLISSPDFKCPEPKNYFSKEISDHSNCSVQYQDKCFIQRDEESISENEITLTCDEVEHVDLQRLSDLYTITKINLRNNRISTLSDMEFPKTIRFIDLSGNNLAKLDNDDLKTLFKNPNMSMLLGNNSFICNCAFVKQLHKHRDQVEDFVSITCADQEKLLHELVTKDLCSSNASYNAAWVATACVVFVIKIIFLLWWYYRNHVKRFFLKKGWCRCCCKREENDAVIWETVQPSKRPSQEDLVES